jgi:hypothetical protein
MHMARFRLPDVETLTHGLNTMLGSEDSGQGSLTVLARERNPRTCTYQSEVVTCRTPDGGELRLLCKYSAGRDHGAFGHRGGVAYEAEVYRQLLESLPVPTPKFYGTHGSALNGDAWFVVAYLDNSQWVRSVSGRRLLPEAARWLGRFHRASELRFSPDALRFLNRHDADYYLGWANRTSEFAGGLHQRFPWLRAVCQRFEEVVDLLLASPKNVIHGEYYPGNFLYRDGTIYPVDWESAAVAMPEIDLASLTDGWPAETAELCRVEYAGARWQQSAPADLERRLAAAHAYWHFRWLGDRPEWTHQPKQLRRFEQLQSLGERLGLI